MDKRFWAIIGVIIAVFVGILFFTNAKDEDTSSGDAKPTSHIKGSTDAKVTLIEYGDFQCPVCGSYYPIVSQVVEKYKDVMSFQYAHLPLSQIHEHAYAAARAAEAAANQDKFWEMYDLLFTNQANWSKQTDAIDAFAAYAKQLNLNIDKYNQDFKSSSVNDRIKADIEAFNKTGLQKATPAFLLNGKQVKPKSVEEFSKLIDAELKKQGVTVPNATDTPAPVPAN